MADAQVQLESPKRRRPWHHRGVPMLLAAILVAFIGTSWFVARSFLLTAGLGADARIEPDSGIEIVGSTDFANQVEKSLTLLKSKSPDAYVIITNNVKRIKQGQRSGMWADETPPTYEMSDKTAFASVTWCAATIAHDSFHSKLYHDCQKANPGRVPDAVWTGTAAERQCMKHQIAVMEQIGAATWEIEHAITYADGHYVKDHDTWRDYRARKY